MPKHDRKSLFFYNFIIVVFSILLLQFISVKVNVVLAASPVTWLLKQSAIDVTNNQTPGVFNQPISVSVDNIPLDASTIDKEKKYFFSIVADSSSTNLNFLTDRLIFDIKKNADGSLSCTQQEEQQLGEYTTGDCAANQSKVWGNFVLNTNNFAYLDSVLFQADIVVAPENADKAGAKTFYLSKDGKPQANPLTYTLTASPPDPIPGSVITFSVTGKGLTGKTIDIFTVKDVLKGVDIQSDSCTDTTCTFTKNLTIPLEWTNETLTLHYVSDVNGDIDHTLVIHFPSLSGAKTLILPTPTPLPPLPPCKSTIDNNGCISIDSALSTIYTDPQNFIKGIMAIFLSLSGGIALLMIIRSGYQLMISQGNAEKVKEAQDRIVSAIVGLLFIIMSLVILEVIGVDILHVPGISH